MCDPSHLALFKYAALLAAQEVYLRQTSVGLSLGEEQRRVGALKQALCHFYRRFLRGKRIVGEPALVGIVVDEMTAVLCVGECPRHII